MEVMHIECVDVYTEFFSSKHCLAEVVDNSGKYHQVLVDRSLLKEEPEQHKGINFLPVVLVDEVYPDSSEWQMLIELPEKAMNTGAHRIWINPTWYPGF